MKPFWVTARRALSGPLFCNAVRFIPPQAKLEHLFAVSPEADEFLLQTVAAACGMTLPQVGCPLRTNAVFGVLTHGLARLRHRAHPERNRSAVRRQDRDQN